MGVDGYYYVLQIETLLTKGRLYFPSNTPVVLYFLSALTFFLGDTTLAIKAGALLMHVLLCAGIGCLVHALTKNALLLALGVLLTASSALHLYFISEFISNLGAVMLLIWSGVGTVNFLQTKNKYWLVLAVVAALGAVFSHASAAWLAVAFLLLGFFAHVWIQRSSLRTSTLLGLLAVSVSFTPLADL